MKPSENLKFSPFNIPQKLIEKRMNKHQKAQIELNKELAIMGRKRFAAEHLLRYPLK
jgi:hypothetical protein